MPVEKVKFKSGGINCAGDLYIPDNRRSGSRGPALVIGHGFSIVKEALVEEAGYFQRAGYVVLAIDYRSFGESEGEPRGQLFPLNESEDYRNAISYLETRDEVDPERIGIWGTSFGGAMVIYTGAVDRRAKAIVAQVPVVNGRRWMQSLRTSDLWLELLDKLEEDRRRRFRTGESARVPVADLAGRGGLCAMPVDAPIMAFLEEAKSGLKTWRADLVMESIEKIIEFNPEAVIHQISPRPLCIVVTARYDMIHPIEHVLDAYHKANEPKKLALLPYDQLGFYTEPGRGDAMRVAIDWFNQYL
ncbi:MAG: alpha/beta hydrolase [Candidatus Binataceae bacterium]|jgi:fermentation-respiration switch protein FrsA (DUF1100 family)